MATGGILRCATHPSAAAPFYCPSCDASYCQDCVAYIARGKVDQCTKCNAIVRRIPQSGERSLSNDRTPPPRGAPAFLDRLGEIIRYPIQSSVVMVLVGLAIFTSVLGWAVGTNISGVLALLGLLFILGLEASVYFHIVRRTALGDDQLDPPEVENLVDDFFAPAFRYVVACSPIVAALFLYGEERFGSVWMGLTVLVEPWPVLDYPLPAALLIAGILLLPLLTAIAAISESAVATLHPGLWLQSLRTMRGTYLAGTVVFYAVMALQYFVLNRALFEIAATVDIPFVTTLFVTTVSYLPLAMRAKVIGAMCEPYMGTRFD